ncbi:Uncharacterised protein [Ewingella americana]|uniref:Uncharacterized protein n=1 Tax=Ewingella americana TaxID=41202 RepID=A0A377N8M2_9GAMM|nr:Uncharacterised protein [Ewingella americana]
MADFGKSTKVYELIKSWLQGLYLSRLEGANRTGTFLLIFINNCLFPILNSQGNVVNEYLFS